MKSRKKTKINCFLVILSVIRDTVPTADIFVVSLSTGNSAFILARHGCSSNLTSVFDGLRVA
jgi:hypothetical protein